MKISLFFFLSMLIFNIYADKIYYGKVTPIVVQTIASGTNFSYYGMVENVARVGSIIRTEITDMDGKVIQKGTVVIQDDKEYWQAQLDYSLDLLKAAKQDYITAEDNYNRYKELFPSGAVSIQDYQAFRAEYYDAIASIKEYEALVIENQQVLNSCTQIAPFEGIVSKVLFIKGRASGNPLTVELTQLNPISVRIRMSREDANKINAATPITVFSPDGKYNQGVINGSSVLCDDGIIIVMTNSIKTANGIGDSSSKKVRDCFAVENFYIDRVNDNIKAVPLSSLKKDQKGFYVWKAENRKFLEPSRALNPIFRVVKVYVIPGDVERLSAGCIEIISLNKADSLEINDLVLTEVPDKLKSGDKVELLPERYCFMPGDSVKVVIGD